MGAVMSFTKVTPEELAWAERHPDELEEFLLAKEEAAGPDGYIDKGWREIQEAFDAADIEVDLRWDGDFMDEEGVYFSWSQRQVAATAELLKAAPFERLRPHFDAEVTESESALEYAEGCYGSLVAFFADAAAARAAAIMTFSY